MPISYDLEVVVIKTELMAANRDVLELVRAGRAFGADWKDACERQHKAFKSFRRIINQPCVPAASFK